MSQYLDVSRTVTDTGDVIEEHLKDSLAKVEACLSGGGGWQTEGTQVCSCSCGCGVCVAAARTVIVVVAAVSVVCCLLSVVCCVLLFVVALFAAPVPCQRVCV